MPCTGASGKQGHWHTSVHHSCAWAVLLHSAVAHCVCGTCLHWPCSLRYCQQLRKMSAGPLRVAQETQLCEVADAQCACLPDHLIIAAAVA